MMADEQAGDLVTHTTKRACVTILMPGACLKERRMLVDHKPSRTDPLFFLMRNAHRGASSYRCGPHTRSHPPAPHAYSHGVTECHHTTPGALPTPTLCLAPTPLLCPLAPDCPTPLCAPTNAPLLARTQTYTQHTPKPRGQTGCFHGADAPRAQPTCPSTHPATHPKRTPCAAPQRSPSAPPLHTHSATAPPPLSPDLVACGALYLTRCLALLNTPRSMK